VWCPECGPPIAAPRDCVSGTWHWFPFLRVVFQEIHAYTNTHTCIYNIYIQIQLYTYIYEHIRTCRQLVQWSKMEAAIFMHIHAYTCIYMHIPTQYVFIFRVRIYIINTCIYMIYVHIYARRKVVILYGFLKKGSRNPKIAFSAVVVESMSIR
jgi:hypothetical protein